MWIGWKFGKRNNGIMELSPVNESGIDIADPTVISGSLTESEQTKLQQLETVINCGKQAFIEVGTALMEIRVNRLYRGEFNTFEGYCQSKWGFNRNFAQMQIQAAQIANEMITTVIIPNEGTAREFISVTPEDRSAVAEQAKAIAAEYGRDTINSRDVKEAKAKRKTAPLYHCTECRNTFTEAEGECPRCYPPEPETVEFVQVEDPEFDEDKFLAICSHFRNTIFDARVAWHRKNLIRLEVEVSNMFHCTIPAAYAKAEA